MKPDYIEHGVRPKYEIIKRHGFLILPQACKRICIVVRLFAEFWTQAVF